MYWFAYVLIPFCSIITHSETIPNQVDGLEIEE